MTLLEERIKDGVIDLDRMSIEKLYGLLDRVDTPEDKNLVNEAILYHREQRRYSFADNAEYCLLEN
jgi:hypothetical protein